MKFFIFTAVYTCILQHGIIFYHWQTHILIANSCALAILYSFFKKLSWKNLIFTSILLFSYSLLIQLLANNQLPNDKYLSQVEQYLRLSHIEFTADQKIRKNRKYFFTLISGEVIKINRKKQGTAILTIDGSFNNKLRVKALITAPDLPWNKIWHVRSGDYISLKIRGRILKSGYRKFSSKENYLWRKGITVIGSNQKTLCYQTTGARSKVNFIKKLYEKFPSTSGLDLIVSLVLGHKDVLSKDLKQQFANLGIGHLLVVSGFHLGVVFIYMSLLSRLLFQQNRYLLVYNRVNLLAKVCALFAVYTYSSSVGFTPPVVRAFIAVLIITLGNYLHRKPSWIISLLICFISVNLIWPAAYLNAGVQLTFSALIGIFCALSLCKKDSHAERNKVIQSITRLTLCCTFAWVATAPLIYYHFETFSVISPLINLLISPVFCIVTIFLGGIAVSIYAITYQNPFLEQIAADFLLFVIEILNHIVSLINWISNTM